MDKTVNWFMEYWSKKKGKKKQEPPTAPGQSNTAIYEGGGSLN